VSDTSTTAPGEVSENPPCIMLDVYNFPVRCDVQDPCMIDFNQTLYYLSECDASDYSLGAFCAEYPQHPVCPVVAVGEPPLPSTGLTEGPVGMGVGLFLVMAGIALVRLVERRKP